MRSIVSKPRARDGSVAPASRDDLTHPDFVKAPSPTNTILLRRYPVAGRSWTDARDICALTSGSTQEALMNHIPHPYMRILSEELAGAFTRPTFISDTRTKSDSLMSYNNSPAGFDYHDDREAIQTIFHS